MAFTVLVMSQLFQSLNWRSQEHSIFKLGLFSNPHLIRAIIFSFLIQMAIIYIPLLQSIFKTVPLYWGDWSTALGISIIPLVAMEVFKFVKSRR